MSLRELLFCQSIIACKLQKDIVDLIKEQKSIKVYLNSYLELEKTNLLTLLSFNSDVIELLLNEENSDQFPQNGALIYKTQIEGPCEHNHDVDHSIDFNGEEVDSDSETVEGK